MCLPINLVETCANVHVTNLKAPTKKFKILIKNILFLRFMYIGLRNKTGPGE